MKAVAWATAAALLLHLAMTARGQEKPSPGVEISREDAASIRALDCEEIEKQGVLLNGKLLKVKFSYRSTAIEKNQAGALVGRIGISRSSYGLVGSKPASGSVRVTLPAEQLVWFTKLPMNSDRRTFVVFARAKEDPEYTGVALELLGRELRTDSRGPKIVW